MWTFPSAREPDAGRPLRAAHAAQVARVHVRRGLRARDRHRRQHRDLQPGRRDARARAAVPRSRPPGRALGQRAARAGRAPRRVVSRTIVDWRAQSKSFEDIAAFDSPVDDARRQRRAGADPDRVRRRRRTSRCSACRRRAAARSRADEDVVAKPRAGRRPERRLVEAALRRRSADRRPHADAVLRAAAVHRRRRDAARLQGAQRRRGVVGAVRAVRAAGGRWPSAARAASRRSRACKPGVTLAAAQRELDAHLAAARTGVPGHERETRGRDQPARRRAVRRRCVRRCSR